MASQKDEDAEAAERLRLFREFRSQTPELTVGSPEEARAWRSAFRQPFNEPVHVVSPYALCNHALPHPPFRGIEKALTNAGGSPEPAPRSPSRVARQLQPTTPSETEDAYIGDSNDLEEKGSAASASQIRDDASDEDNRVKQSAPLDAHETAAPQGNSHDTPTALANADPATATTTGPATTNNTGPGVAQSSWSTEEKDILIESVQWILAHGGRDMTVLNMWKAIAKRAKSSGNFKRTANACRIEWGRFFRQETGMDERKEQKPHQLVTSAQH
ncbi:hypothetical protein HDK64DRAFT_312922 [Phyllosticta capitalensis]